MLQDMTYEKLRRPEESLPEYDAFPPQYENVSVFSPTAFHW